MQWVSLMPLTANAVTRIVGDILSNDKLEQFSTNSKKSNQAFCPKVVGATEQKY